MSILNLKLGRRQFQTLHTARLRQYPRRRPCVRAPEFIPRFLVLPFRVPIAGLIIGAGALWYANYKLEELRKKITGWLTGVQDAVTDSVGSASDGIKFVSARVSAVKLPDIETPQFLRGIFASDNSTLDKKTNGWLSTVQGPATDLIGSASDRIKSGVSAVKLPNIKTPQFLKDLFPPKDG